MGNTLVNNRIQVLPPKWLSDKWIVDWMSNTQDQDWLGLSEVQQGMFSDLLNELALCHNCCDNCIL